MTEYNKLKKYIKDFEDQTGTLYHIAILLSKCDKEAKKLDKSDKSSLSNTNEIIDSDEDTDIYDLIDKVKQKFANDDIILFNAYGRSYHHERSSAVLQKFIKKMVGVPQKDNIQFRITKYIANYKEDQKKLYYNKFIDRFNQFVNNKLDIESLICFWKNIDRLEKINHLIIICSEKVYEQRYKYFNYVMYILNIENFCLEHSDESDIVNNFLITSYLNMLIDTKNLKKVNNLWYDYTNVEVYNSIYKYFVEMNNSCQQIWYEEFMTYKYINTQLQIGLLKYFNFQGLNYKAFNYKLLFEKIILQENIEQYRKYYDVMVALLNIETSFEFKYFDESKEDILNIYIRYLEHLKNLSNNEDYILLNKLQIINNIYHKKIYNQCHFYSKTLNDLTIDKNRNIIVSNSRLKSNDKYIEIIRDIWKKIYSNIQISFNEYYDYSNFIPIDVIELKYTVEIDKPDTEE